MKKNVVKKMFVGIFIYSFIIGMILFAVGCPIAAIGYALAGDYLSCIIAIILAIVGIGGYTYLVTNEH